MSTLHPIARCFLDVGPDSLDELEVLCKTIYRESLGLFPQVRDVALVRGVVQVAEGLGHYDWASSVLELTRERIAELLPAMHDEQIADLAKALLSEFPRMGAPAVESIIDSLDGEEEGLKNVLHKLLMQDEAASRNQE